MIFRKRRHQPPAEPPPPPILRCTFCNKSQRDVKKLIAGPKVYICDECVGICIDILAEDRVLVPRSGYTRKLPDAVEGVVLDPPPSSRRPLWCKFCGTLSAVEFCVPVAGRGWLCGACLEAVREVLDASKPEA